MRNKYTLKATVAAAAIAMSMAPALAGNDDDQEAQIVSYFGHIDPFYGDIAAFEGELDASYGHIDPFFGHIDPFFGNINPFFGHINPFDAAGHNQHFGDISPFWGNIDPFWGDISPFFGNIDPFWGDISPFYGTIHPFYDDPAMRDYYEDLETHYGDIGAFWGDISAFWGDMGPMWGDLNAFWGDLVAFGAEGGDLDEMQRKLKEMDAEIEATWGAAIEAKTGKSYREFADAFYARHDLDLDDPSTFSEKYAYARSVFFLDFYDTLMGFSGMDHVDHWMGTINWTPAITQDLGGGSDAVIGLLDSNITYDDELLDNISRSKGYEVDDNFHGAAVASLLIGEHNGRGIMGIAPDAEITLFNPFDSTGTTNWHDVTQGIEELADRGADVINMSLGMPEWVLHEGWADVLTNRDIVDEARNVLFVKAAGNDGITQDRDINWRGDQSLLDQLILVGSVGPTEVISPFSNRPGEACIVTGYTCVESNKLKYKFIVAPGENLLVSDDKGGTVRVSGTSFAAPLVAGTVTLIQDRWPWLQRDPEVVSQLIFHTAKDLGEPGVDGVYGWGLLDVEAALSPLSFDSLAVYAGWDKMRTSELKKAILNPGTLDLWEEKGVVLSSFENYEGEKRDFLIPMSSLVHGEEYYTAYWSKERVQSYIYQRLIDWAHGDSSFSDRRSKTAPLGANSNWQLSMTASRRPYTEERRTGQVPFHTDMMLTSVDGRARIQFGTGQGASMLSRSGAFGFASDHDPMSGGVNPVFGFASGGAYAGASMALTDRATFGVSFSSKTDDHTYQDVSTGQIMREQNGLADYEADATNFEVSYRLNDIVTMNLGYTELVEETGLLGAQGGGALSLDGGASTTSGTVGFDFALPRNIDLGFSATSGYTEETNFDGSAFRLTGGGAKSSAYEVAALKTGVIGKSDKLRLSFAQPLHVEDGALELRTMAIVDRETGEMGPVTQLVPLGGDNRPYVAEMLYATPLMGEAAEISTFTRAETNTRATTAGIVEYSAGASFRISF